MNSLSKNLSALTFVVAASLASGCVIAGDDSTLTIANESDYVFVDLAVRGAGDFDYSANLLGSAPLFPGQEVTVILDCDTYDVFIEDDAAGQCELTGLSLCFDDALWVVDNFELNSCVFGSATGPRLLDDPSEVTSERVIEATDEALELMGGKNAQSI